MGGGRFKGKGCGRDDGRGTSIQVGGWKYRGKMFFSCGEVSHMAGFCPRNAWSKNRKNEFKGEGWVGVGWGRGRCFGYREDVGQCIKASPRKCFSNGEMGHLSLQCKIVPMCFGCRELSHTAVSCSKLRHLNDNNNNNICLKSNIQTSSVDYAPRELTHACSRSETCSRSDTEACDMCYVF